MNHFYSNLKLMLVALFACVGIGAWADEVTDVLNQSVTGVTGTNYTAFSNKTATSDAVYAGQCAGDKSSIQLRSNNSNSGVITTTSGGTAKKVVVTWHEDTNTARTLSVYGSNTAYTAATDLYDAEKQGTLIGELVCSAATAGVSTLEIDDEYAYIGFRSKSGAMYLTSVAITWATGSEAPAVATPVISPSSCYFTDRIEVTATCATEGATIYYSTNGADPDPASSPVWGRPLPFTETTTIKAIAVKGENVSAVATATFTKIPSYSTFASMSALENNALFAYTGDARIIAKPTAKYVYVMDSPFDNPTYALIYDASGEKAATAEVGKMIPGGWTGKVSIYNKLFELVPDNAIVVSDEPAQPINYPAIALGTAKMNQVFTLKGVTSYSANGKNISIYVNGEDKDISEAQGVYGYNQFAIEIPAFEEGKTYEIVGAIGQYNDKVQFWPISIQEESEPGPEPELGFYVAGSMTEWGIVAANKMTMDEELEKTKHIKEFSLTLPLKANDGVKVASSYGADPITWFPTGSGNEYVVEADGDYTVYCRPNFDGDETWIEKCLKVVPVAAPTVWEAYPGWTRDNMASARYFGIKTPGTAADAYAISAFQIAQESGYGASTSYAVIATDVPEGTALDASKVVAVSTDAVTPDVAAPGKFFDYALTEEVVLKGATVYYVAFTTSNEPVDGSFTVQGQRVSLNVNYGTYPYPYVDGGGTARTTWTPGFKAELTLPTFAISCAEVENGKVETNVAEAKVGDKVIVTATPAEGYKLKAIMVTGKTSDIAVEVAEDGSFIMPADDVTVSATFKDLASVVYIETDLTAQFSSLTDWTKWVGATGYTATNFCPAVTTNAGQNVQVCEKYVTNCTETGEIFYQTLTGLAEGTYKIELFGGAAYTFGRGFDSEAFSGGTWNAGDKITENTGVKLYAVTSEGEFGGEIPIYYATNFPDGAAVVTLNDVKVGSNGELKIGMSKTSKSTNWHVIQLKGVTATVDAAALLANTVKEAKAIDPATIPAALATEIGDVIVANDKEYETADEYKAAIAAIDAVVAKAVAYAPLTAVLAQGEIYKSHVAEGDAAIAAYEEAIADVAAAYATVSVADIPAAIAVVEAALPALAKAQTADGSDMTLAIVNPEINGADGWTCEKPLGGNGPLLNNTAFEYWAGNASNRAEASFDYYQVIEGLPNGLYTVSADMYNSTNGEDGAVFAPTSGVYASADNEEATLVDVDGTDWITYATDVVLVSDGKLRIGVKSTEKPMAARWFAADNFKLTLVKALSETELAYEKAIASIEDSASYRIFTTVNEKKFYLNNTGYLVADANKAASFTFAEVNASGTLYETGINLGCKFTNPKLTSGATGDVVKQGHIIVGTNDRNDWERQVFFLKDGKYAVRATNANSANWGANTYWTVDNIEAELPNAEYALDPAYVWEIEKYVDNRPSAYAIAQTWPAKLQAIEGLVTDAANWTTNAQEGSEGAIKNICDGDVKTFFHSQWSGTGPDADHYIQATLPEAAQKFHIAFYKRNDSNRPTSIVVSAGDAEPAQTITEGLPAPAWYSAEVDLGTAADVVRFTVPTTSTGGANNGHVYFTFGEFYILPSNELTDAACKYIVSDYTDIDPDFDPAEVESIDAQIEVAYQQIMLKEELADLAACIARGKEFIAAYPVEDAEQLAQEATGTLDRLAEGEYTTKEEVASAKANAILTVQLFIGATGTPTVDADITEWFVKNPTPIATQAVAEGWEGDKFGDASDGVSEYWNKAAATFHQTITLPAGDYKLTVVALQRTNMAGVVYAGDAQKTIAQATTDEANSRGQAAAWFNAGNGVNEVKFTMAEAGEIEIGLITDNTTGDHWTVWQSFKIEKLAPVPPVAFTVTPNIASGTQAEFTTVEAGTALKLTVSTENLEANGYDPKDISLKVGTLFAGRFPDKGFAMGTNERPPYMKNDIVLPLADEVTLADDVFGTEYPFIQSIRITDLSLVKGEEPIAAINEMIVISFIEVYENGKPVGIKAIATEGEKADIYDLSGRKVEKVQRGGIYIINGKKVSMK